MKTEKYFADPKNFKLKDFDTSDTGNFKDKTEVEEKMKENLTELSELQDVFYASNKYSLLLIFQAMDAAGKDGTIKHVMKGVNPQGCQVVSFKQPSSEELDHDYLWRAMKNQPERGRFGIFNRSYYEDVLVVKVHNLLESSQLPKELLTKDVFEKRYRQIKNYEEYLTENGIIVLKFFLNISKEEQAKRFLERIDDESKNWKFSMGDVKERKYWDEYQKAYEEAIKNTSTKEAPWYVIPADHKWYMRYLVSEIIIDKLKSLKLEYPKLTKEQLQELQVAKEALLHE
ncbi:polyphosphate kinase 2 family protein [Guggenheimella bovis]